MAAVAASLDIVCYSTDVSRLLYRHRQYNSISIILCWFKNVSFWAAAAGLGLLKLLYICVCVPLWLRLRFLIVGEKSSHVFSPSNVLLIIATGTLPGGSLYLPFLKHTKFKSIALYLGFLSLSLILIHWFNCRCVYAVAHTDDVKSELRIEGLRWLLLVNTANKFINKVAN